MCALLEDQRTRAAPVDVQHRKSTACHGAVSRKAARDQTRCHLDDSGTDRLADLRGVCVGGVSHLDSRTRRRISGGYDRAQQSTNGSHSVAVGVRLVFDGPTRIAFRDAAAVQCKPRARGATRMGADLRDVLDVLAGVDGRDGRGVVVMRTVFVEYLAELKRRGSRDALQSAMRQDYKAPTDDWA